MNITAAATGIKSTVGFLSDLPKQTRFATAKTLTQSAWAAQKWTVDKLLPSKFTLRAKSRPWQKFGKYRFKVQQATKERLQATLSSDAPWIKDHEHGGTRTGQQDLGGVPISFSARPSKKSVIPARLKPRKALKRKGSFIGDAGNGGKALYIPHQAGDGAVRLLYLIRPSVRIKKTLGFEKQAPKIATREFNRRFNPNIAAAYRDAARRHFRV